MIELYFLAETAYQKALYANMTMLVVRFLLLSFALHLCSLAFLNIPFLQNFMRDRIGQILIILLLLGASVLFVFKSPSLRILHETGLIRSAKIFIWPDIIFSGLVLTRLSYVWPDVFNWFVQQSR